MSTGAGGIALVGASSSPASTFVAVTPERVLDTRASLGLDGPLTSPTGRNLQISGPVATVGGTRTVVPPGATAVVMNVTVVGPTADGFVSVRPAGTPGAPTTSNLNFAAGAIVPNAVTVALPTSGAQAGAIELTYDAFAVPGPTTDMLVDVTGYYVAADTSGTGGAGATGPAGPAGPRGPAGEPAFATEGVVHVARNGTPDGSNGAFDSVQAAVASITDASITKPYVVKIGPGIFDGRVTMKSNVALQGAGIRDTILRWTGGSQSPFSDGASATVDISRVTEVKLYDLTVQSNAGPSSAGFAVGIWISNANDVRLTRVEAGGANGSSESYGVFARGSAPQLTDVRANAFGGSNTRGMAIEGGFATLRRVEATGSGASSTNRGLEAFGGTSVRAEDLTATASGSTGIAVVNVGSTIRMRDSRLVGSLRSVSAFSGATGSPTTSIATSQVDGALGDGITCVGSYDSDYGPIGGSCN